MKKYLCDIVKYGALSKIVKRFAILFALLTALDAINYPTEIIKNKSLLFFLSIFIGIIVVLILFLYENNIHNLIKAKVVNELDSYFSIGFVGCLCYTLLLFVPGMFKVYKLVICLLLALTALTLLCYRKSYLYKKVEEKFNENIYDLKEFLENKTKPNNNYPILFAEKDVAYDLFDRKVVINQLFSSLMACRFSDCSFVIGLEGPWGSGKTTIVNNVIKRINEEAADDFVLISNFDPWIYDSQQALLVALFEKILNGSGIRYSASTINTITKNIIHGIMGDKVGGIVENLLFHENPDDEIQKIKEQISSYLSKNNKTITVFIDNLDRASAENLIFLLKIISTIFDLKRVVYVLSYDKERLNDILVNNFSINKHYIEKIVQQEIKVTKLNRDKFRSIVSDCLYKLFEAYGVPKEKQSGFDYTIDFLSRYSEDLREFKRIINSVGTNLAVDNKLYKPDLFCLELVRFLDNELYEEIHNNAQYYISVDIDKNVELYSATYNREKFNKNGKAYFERVEKKYNPVLLNLLSNVFPYIEKYLNGNELRPKYSNDESRNKQISLNCGAASAKYFDLYFHFGDNEYTVITGVYRKLIGLINAEKQKGTTENIPDIFNVAFDELPVYYHLEIISKLWFERKDFDADLNLPVFVGLIRNANRIDKEKGFLSLSAYERACSIMATLFSLLTLDEKNELIKYLSDYYKLLNTYDEILYWLKSSSLQYQQKDEDVDMFQNMIDDLYDKVMENGIDIYADENYGYHNAWSLLRARKRKLNLGEKDDVDIHEYISKIIKPQYVFKVLTDAIGMSIGNRGYGYYIDEGSLQSLVMDERIIDDYLSEVVPQNDNERFICTLYDAYKNGEVDDWGKKAIYVDHFIRLW